MHPDRPAPRDILITVMLGAAGLAVAQGIGRFAFTPLLPLMQARGEITLAQGAWLAAANYLGYFAGAVLCTLRAPAPLNAARHGLTGVAIATVAMGLAHAFSVELVLRFAAGLSSAFALVGFSAIAIARLAAAGRAHWGGWVFAGVGSGVFVAGIVGYFCGIFAIPPARAWLGLGIASFAVVVPVWRLRSIPVSRIAGRMSARLDVNAWTLVACYGTYGFGYIIPATFLPALAREAVSDPASFGLAWPVFGLAGALSTIFAGSVFRATPPRRLWSWSNLILAFGIALPAIDGGFASLLVSALCVGGTFVTITMAGMQEARRLHGAAAVPLMAAMTAAFAAGQVIAPIAVSLCPPGPGAIRIPSLAAAAGLILATVVLLRGTATPDAASARDRTMGS